MHALPGNKAVSTGIGMDSLLALHFGTRARQNRQVVAMNVLRFVACIA
jgi:hypothetical protein